MKGVTGLILINKQTFLISKYLYIFRPDHSSQTHNSPMKDWVNSEGVTTLTLWMLWRPYTPVLSGLQRMSRLEPVPIFLKHTAEAHQLATFTVYAHKCP